MNIVLKLFLTGVVISTGCTAANAQVDSIFFNLYTDSLKKGTYNYINVVARLKDGKYFPMDTTHVVFSTTYGYFKGNSLWVPEEYSSQEIRVEVALIKNSSQRIEKLMSVKTAPDDEMLPQEQDLMPSRRPGRKRN